MSGPTSLSESRGQDHDVAHRAAADRARDIVAPVLVFTE